MILRFDELREYRHKVAMVDGAFDPLHKGHIEYFRAAVDAVDVPLLCNVASDRYGPNQTPSAPPRRPASHDRGRDQVHLIYAPQRM